MTKKNMLLTEIVICFYLHNLNGMFFWFFKIVEINDIFETFFNCYVGT